MAPLDKNVIPDENIVDGKDRSVNPNEHRESTRSWDEHAQTSPVVGKAYIENQRRNLNATRKRRLRTGIQVAVTSNSTI